MAAPALAVFSTLSRNYGNEVAAIVSRLAGSKKVPRGFVIRVNVHNSPWRIPDLFKRGLVNKHHHYQQLQHWTEPRVFTFSLANRSHHGHPDPYSLALATATFRRGDPIHPSIGRKEGRSFDVDAAAACGLACSRWAEGRVR